MFSYINIKRKNHLQFKRIITFSDYLFICLSQLYDFVHTLLEEKVFKGSLNELQSRLCHTLSGNNGNL